MIVRFVQRVRYRGGPAYMPGETVGVPDAEGADFVRRGWAVAVPGAAQAHDAPGGALAAVPVVSAPPADKMVRSDGARRK